MSHLFCINAEAIRCTLRTFFQPKNSWFCKNTPEITFDESISYSMLFKKIKKYYFDYNYTIPSVILI